MKKLFVLMCLLVFSANFAYSLPLFNENGGIYVIDAEKNAYFHNNYGLIYLKEGYYYGAIKEFKIAIDLNPNTQATSIYYANLASTYLKIGQPGLAQASYEKAINLNPMNFEYYKQIVLCYKKQNILKSKLQKYKTSSNPLSQIIVGLIQIESGDIKNGIMTLDDFCYKEPELIITDGVRNFVSEKSYFYKKH